MTYPPGVANYSRLREHASARGQYDNYRSERLYAMSWRNLKHAGRPDTARNLG